MSIVEVLPSPQLSGQAIVPGDKSISHRALLLSALAEGTSSISGISSGDDVTRTAKIVTQLGATIERQGDVLIVAGGRSLLHGASDPLDFGNSGTGMRLAMGIVAGIPGLHQLHGDHSLSSRPMDRVARPLGHMGARIVGQGERCTAPLEISGAALGGIEFAVPVPSAQVKSAILLAALGAKGRTLVTESVRTRPHTEAMIAEAGGRISVTDGPDGRSIELEPSELEARDWKVAADPSQSAFFVVAALLASSSTVSVHDLYPDPTRIGFLSVLARMGASLEIEGHDGRLSVTARSSELMGTTIHGDEIPSLDEVPILAVAAAAAEGITRFVGVAELRIKESDRFDRTIELMSSLGASCSGDGDDLVVEGLGTAKRFSPVSFDAHEDHRMAMSAAIAGTVGSGARVAGFETVASSFPGFLDVLGGLHD
jgi:3-phosphoshikimate 1-carboxyvinyltransferase